MFGCAAFQSETILLCASTVAFCHAKLANWSVTGAACVAAALAAGLPPGGVALEPHAAVRIATASAATDARKCLFKVRLLSSTEINSPSDGRQPFTPPASRPERRCLWM